MPCNEETPLLYESERNLKTTVFQMVLSFIGLILCIMLIVLPIIIASMILMGSSHHEDVELSYSILINKLRHRTIQPNSLVDDAESALQYEFVVPLPALKSDKIQVDNIKLEEEIPESNDRERRLHHSTTMPWKPLATKTLGVSKSSDLSENPLSTHLSDVMIPQSSLMLNLVKATYSEDIEEGIQT